MKPERDEIAFEWIRSRCDESAVSDTPEGRAIFVAHLVPPMFEAYARVLHRMDARHEEIDQPLSPSERRILQIPSCEPLRSFVEQRRADGGGTRIKWRELAELLNVPYVPEITAEWLRKRLEDGWCFARFLGGTTEADRKGEQHALTSHLRSCTEAQECFFRFSDIPFYQFSNAGPPRLFKGTLNEVDGLPDTGPYRGGPEYWWPSDKRWCVCSDYDLHETIIGGPRQLISSLLTSDVLECLEVSPQSRIDPFVPMP